MRAVVTCIVAILALGLGYDPALAQAGGGPALKSIHMIDSLTGWAVTDQPAASALLRTTDGGAQWKDVTPLTRSGQQIVVGHISVLTSSIAWVSRKMGPSAGTTQVFRTVDSGRTWRNEAIMTHDVSSIHFINLHSGWLLSEEEAHMGREAVGIYRSIDSGETWVKISGTSQEDESSGLPYDGDKEGIVFLNPTTGWITGIVLGSDWLYLYVTHDGGLTWRDQSIPLPPQLKPHWRTATLPPAFFTTQDGVLPVSYSIKDESYKDVAGGVVFFITHDGGTTWAYTTPVSITLGNGFSTSFADIDHGWVMDGTALYATSDGGRQWKKIAPGPPFTDVNQLDFVSPYVGWAVTEVPPFLLKTVNGGHTWAAVVYTVSRQ